MNDPCTQEAPAIAEARHIPFLEWLGAHRERVADGEAVVAVDLVPELLNNHGGGHGGVAMTLLDNAMANAALSRIAYTREVVTIDIHVAFVSPATRAPPTACRSSPRRMGCAACCSAGTRRSTISVVSSPMS